MVQITEKYPGVVTQHFLGMTYETRPMYYLKVSEKAANYLNSLVHSPLTTYCGHVNLQNMFPNLRVI